MNINVGKEVAALRQMTNKELRTRYAEVFGESTNTKNAVWLVKRIAWRLQALAEGGLSERARQRAAELANDADLRMSPPQAKPGDETGDRCTVASFCAKGDHRLPLPGTVLTRQYKGQSLQVMVLPHGFEYEGEVFKSLSAVAKTITGQHCNGYLFFRLTRKDGEE